MILPKTIMVSGQLHRASRNLTPALKRGLCLQPCGDEEATLLRFLKARKFDTQAAADQLQGKLACLLS